MASLFANEAKTLSKLLRTTITSRVASITPTVPHAGRRSAPRKASSVGSAVHIAAVTAPGWATIPTVAGPMPHLMTLPTLVVGAGPGPSRPLAPLSNLCSRFLHSELVASEGNVVGAFDSLLSVVVQPELNEGISALHDHVLDHAVGGEQLLEVPLAHAVPDTADVDLHGRLRVPIGLVIPR